jgi:hypothetical protein
MIRFALLLLAVLSSEVSASDAIVTNIVPMNNQQKLLTIVMPDGTEMENVPEGTPQEEIEKAWRALTKNQAYKEHPQQELMEVEMPDGTIIGGVPVGTTKAELQAKLDKLNPPTQQAPVAAAPEEKGVFGRTVGGAPTKLPEGAVLLDDKTPPPPEGFTLESPPSEAAVDAEIAALEAELAARDKEQKSNAAAWIEDALFFMMQATIGIVCFLLYISPAIIAWKRRHQNKIPISLLNIVAGWTGLGWVAALIWASKAPTKQS